MDTSENRPFKVINYQYVPQFTQVTLTFYLVFINCTLLTQNYIKLKFLLLFIIMMKKIF